MLVQQSKKIVTQLLQDCCTLKPNKINKNLYYVTM
nr:MAG TPA: Kappa-conotoxin PVIIA knot, inhibitor, TOXIN [Caudoviricetes sp.]